MYSKAKLKSYYLTAVFSMVFAILGFSYNTWRLEVSEDNNTIRTASFEVLKQLSELEQVVFAAHYDRDNMVGNPRTGWVKVGLINDLSVLITPEVATSSEQLKISWQQHWEALEHDELAAQAILTHIDTTRLVIKDVIITLN